MASSWFTISVTIPIHPCERRPSGFTLLEVLLAVTILGIIMMTVYGALSRTLSSKLVGEERSEMYSNGRDAVLQIANDVEGATRPGVGDRIYFRGQGGSGQVPSLEFVGMNRGGYGQEQVRAGRVLIVYTLDPISGQRGLFALRREEHLFAALLAEADGVDSSTEEQDEGPSVPTAVATYVLDCPQIPDEIPLPGNCARVVGLSFRYFDEASGQWTDEWDSTQSDMQDRIPSAVEIALLLADERGVEHDFSTIVDLPLARGQPTPGPESGDPEADSSGSEGLDDGDADEADDE